MNLPPNPSPRMTSPAFFDKAKTFLDAERPFAVYRKPAPTAGQFSVDGFFQNDAHLYHTTDFNEPGFVFSPFDSNRPSILIPLGKADKVNTSVFIPDELKEAQTTYSENPTEKRIHEALIAKGVLAIRESGFKKVVLSRKIEASTARNPISLFQLLLKHYPTAFVYCWFHPTTGLWLGATPESLISLSGKTLKTMAVAGTKPAKVDENPKWTSKEIEEQQLVTDFIIKSLKNKASNLTISKTMDYRAGDLWHLRTDISGRLSGHGLKEILAALHPTPAVCGLPKAAAKQFILENENYDREFYTGFIGELNLPERRSRAANRQNIENQAYTTVQHNTELFVNLRCMQMGGKTCKIYVGGGITGKSQPGSEWQETVNKAQTLLKVL